MSLTITISHFYGEAAPVSLQFKTTKFLKTRFCFLIWVYQENNPLSTMGLIPLFIMNESNFTPMLWKCIPSWLTLCSKYVQMICHSENITTENWIVTVHTRTYTVLSRGTLLCEFSISNNCTSQNSPKYFIFLFKDCRPQMAQWPPNKNVGFRLSSIVQRKYPHKYFFNDTRNLSVARYWASRKWACSLFTCYTPYLIEFHLGISSPFLNYVVYTHYCTEPCADCI